KLQNASTSRAFPVLQHSLLLRAPRLELTRCDRHFGCRQFHAMLGSISMKQLLQNITTGKAMVVDVPAPQAGPGEILVRVGASLVSAGTERMVVEFAEKNVVQKALARPDLVRQVLNKAWREGVLSTMSSVRQRLDTDMALGYSNA